MAILDPRQNIPAIISMIDNAQEFVIIVSPYTDLNGWDELKSSINRAAERFEVKYFVREGPGRDGLEGLNVTVFDVPGLHAKMFFSEKEALIGSFHLKHNNDINWAYKLKDDEYTDLVEFFEKFILPLSKPASK